MARYGIARPTVTGASAASFEFDAASRLYIELQCGSHDGGPFQTACPHLFSLIKCLQLADREMTDPHSVGPGGAMLTKDILFGMNIMTLAGFALMGLSLSLNRTGQIGAPLSVGLMCAGTALVFFGLYAGSEPR